MRILEAGRDISALEHYLPLFIEQAAMQAESSLAARRRSLRRAAAISAARLDSIPCSFRVPYAFELWIAHLGWLDRLAAGVQLTLDDLTTEEARGLALLRQEREKFWQAHCCCPQCQSVNVSGASFCGTCGVELSK